MKFSLLSIALVATGMLTACGSPGAPQPPSLHLPEPVRDLRAFRKGSGVTLKWSSPRLTTDAEAIREGVLTRICRSFTPPGLNPEPSEQGESLPAKCGSGGGEVRLEPQDLRSGKENIFVDTLPAELLANSGSQFLSYAVESRNSRGRSAGLSNLQRVSLASTLPPPHEISAKVTADGVLIAWPGNPAATNSTGHRDQEDGIEYLYRVDRLDLSLRATIPQGGKVAAKEGTARAEGASVPGENKRGTRPRKKEEMDRTKPVFAPAGREPAAGGFSVIGELPVGYTSRTLTLVDKNFLWEHAYRYKVTPITRVKVDGETTIVEGDDSPLVEVFVHDIFPPAAPAGLQAVAAGANGARFIDLSWSPNHEPDLMGYNVYRREGGETPARINPQTITVPAIRDPGVVAGKTYFYSVTAVDLRGNESERSEEASETVRE